LFFSTLFGQFREGAFAATGGSGHPRRASRAFLRLGLGQRFLNLLVQRRVAGRAGATGRRFAQRVGDRNGADREDEGRERGDQSDVREDSTHWLCLERSSEDSACGTRADSLARRDLRMPGVAPKQRQIRIEQRGAQQAIEALEQRSDEELEAETKYKSAALAILGARASERFDAKAARAYFQRAIAAARPQERMQLRRMADASLALAERRAGDLKDAVARLGHDAPTGRQMLALRAMGLLIPPASAGILARMRGILLIVVLIVALLAVGLGVVELVSLPFGGLGLAPGILLGLFVAIAAVAIVAMIGRRRRDRAATKAAAGKSASR